MQTPQAWPLPAAIMRHALAWLRASAGGIGPYGTCGLHLVRPRRARSWHALKRCNNLLSQLWTWDAGDISANPTYGGDFEAALGAIKARTIIVPVDNDRYFPPVDSKNEAKHIPGAKVSVVASAWGHMALMNPADIPAIDAPLNELLAG